MVLQLLSHSKKNAKGKTYTYYSLAEPYWDGKKNKKRDLGYIGTLTPLQVQQIRNTLKVTQSLDIFTATFDDLIFEDHWRYLDMAFLNHLWDQEWKGLSSIFPTPEETSNTRKKDISTADVAKLLTFYRCLDPGSYLSSVEWFETTACNFILDIDPIHFNESRIYRELTVIEQQKENIEQWLYQTRKACELYFMISRIRISKEENVRSRNLEEQKLMVSEKKELFFLCSLIQKATPFHGKSLKTTTTLLMSQHL
jgi:hypothetical protein